MINVENYVINSIANTLSDITVLGDYVEVPPTFPCVTVVEESNVSADTFDNHALTENHVDVMYSVNVYSNLISGAKSQAKKIMGDVDAVLQGLKFTRTMCQPIPNVDHTIYRYTARYTARIGKGVTDSGTTTYQVYRE